MEITDNTKIVDRKIGWTKKYYISGITSNGTEITFEVSDSTYFKIIEINQAKKIDIRYWKHSKTLCSWDVGSY